MISKNLDLVKNKPVVSTHFYYTKQQPVSKPTRITDAIQDLEFRVQTLSKPIALYESDLCLEITTSGDDIAVGRALLYNTLRSVLDGLELQTATGQRLFWINRYIWAYAQVHNMYLNESNVNQRGNTYEAMNFGGQMNLGANLAGYNDNLGAAQYRDQGVQISLLNGAAGSRKLFIRIPLKKLGGIFREETGLVPFVDDQLYFTFKLNTRNNAFQIINGNATENVPVGTFLDITQIYLNIARSRDDEINKSLMKQVMSGVQFPYHLVSQRTDSFPNTTSVQINHSITQNEGKKIFSIDTCFITNNPSLEGIHENGNINFSGFMPIAQSLTAEQKEVLFDNDVICSEHAFLSSMNENVDLNQLIGRYHIHYCASDDPLNIDTGFELSNLPSTNWMIKQTFSANIIASQATSFFTGVQYVRQNSNSIQTMG